MTIRAILAPPQAMTRRLGSVCSSRGDLDETWRNFRNGGWVANECRSDSPFLLGSTMPLGLVQV